VATASEGVAMIPCILTTIVALLIAWLGVLVAPAVGAAVPGHAEHTHTYDSWHATGADAGTHHERGPPESYDLLPTSAATAVRWSRGASARPDGATSATYHYDHTASLVQRAAATGTTMGRRQVAWDDSASLMLRQVAANAGSRLGVQVGTKI
jgi:hypothetical protein